MITLKNNLRECRRAAHLNQKELAAQIGYEQIDLEVVADNTRALTLYRKCGFTETGRKHRALKFDDGTYHDEILMTRILV